MRTIDRLLPPLAALSAAVFLLTIGLIFGYAPVEREMGIVQKIFYAHVPSAMAAYAGFTVTSVCGLIYLFRPNRTFDLVARSGAELGMVFCSYVLISGPLWALKAWGEAWTWDPQLTATFVLFLLYGGYVLLRALSPDTHSIRQISALIAVIAFVDIPIIHYAVRKWGGLHPTVEREGGSGLAPDVKLVFSVSMIAFLLLFVALLLFRVRTRMLRQRIETLHLDLADATYEAG